MNGNDVNNVRNFVLVGHNSCGKTTLTGALLTAMSVGEPQDVSASMIDYMDEEKSRKMTIFAKPFTATYRGIQDRMIDMIFIDTPGHADFCGQMIAACHAADAAVVVVDAVSGVQIGTLNVWRRCEKLNLPCSVVITGLDRENADFAGVLAQLKNRLSPSCIPVIIPTTDLSNVVNVIETKGEGQFSVSREEAYNSLVEIAAETDDALIEKFLGGEELSTEEFSRGLKKAMCSRKLVPVFACMPLKNIGITQLLDYIARFFPAPVDIVRKDASGNNLSVATDAPFAALVWRVVNDPFTGQQTFVRILSGTLHLETETYNVTQKQKERMNTLLVINGKKQTTVEHAIAGQIVAIPKLKVTKIGDILCESGKEITYPCMQFPNPVMFVAVKGKTQGDEDKIGVALSRVCEEDTTLRVIRNSDTKQTILAGMGDTHIDVAISRIKSRSNIEIVVDTPKVSYRETVTARGEGHYKHKKQTGGRGQYGEVYMRIEPKSDDDEEWFVDEIVGGAIPGNFMPAVQKGVLEGMSAGALAGFPVIGVKVRIYDGSYHEVDSSEISFKIAAVRAFKDAMLKAKPVLLEPIMTVKVTIPEQYMGDITGDLNHRRGRILGMAPDNGLQIITAEIPQAELFRYPAELRSMTAGQGSFEMEFNRYEIVPANIAQKIIAAEKKEQSEEE